MTQDIFDGQPLTLMPVSRFAIDLELIWKSVGTTRMPNPAPDDAEWEDIIERLIPDHPSEIGSASWLRSYSERDRAALGYTANRLWHLTQRLGIHPNGAPDPEWVLAHADWKARMTLCLGIGVIPFAWVRLTDAN